jgi:hypothetical protein
LEGYTEDAVKEPPTPSAKAVLRKQKTYTPGKHRVSDDGRRCWMRGKYLDESSCHLLLRSYSCICGLLSCRLFW